MDIEKLFKSLTWSTSYSLQLRHGKHNRNTTGIEFRRSIDVDLLKQELSHAG